MTLSPLRLDAPSEEENLKLWVQEAQRMLNDLREGRANLFTKDLFIDLLREVSSHSISNPF